MDKIFHSTFDFFSYAIPGCFIIFSVFILDYNFKSGADIMEFVGDLKIGSGILILAVGYVVGFAINPLGRFLYKTLGFRLFKHHFKDYEGLSISDKYVLLRELSPLNFKYVETWNVYSSMAHNLAFASIIIIINCIVKIILVKGFGIIFWLVIIGSFIILFFLFLERAVRFSVWAATDINSSLDVLQLEKKAKLFAISKDKKTT